jgi:threonylcarbamoyladenosine tRNA methylthiotransferase MtaB
VSAIDGVDLIESDPKKIATEFLKVPLLPGIKRVKGRDKAFVKVQEGCDQFCAYCIVPYARGGPRNRPLEDIIQEVNDLIDNGYAEFVLTGTNLGKREDLLHVVKSIEEIEGVRRIGLGSIEPLGISDELLDFLGSSPKFLKYLHVPLQSGDDRVLDLMGRWYDSNQYRGLITRISDKIPDCAIGADVIVGFPGEGEEEFLKTHDLIADSPICRLHVFRYSKRPGTRALDLPGESDEATKKKRSAVLRDLGEEKWHRFRSQFVGKMLEVHVESAGCRASLDGQLVGMTDNYIRVLLGSGNSCVDLKDAVNPSSPRASCGVGSWNDFENVRITKIDGARTYGEIVREKAR